jgi:hypothetical protein
MQKAADSGGGVADGAKPPHLAPVISPAKMEFKIKITVSTGCFI